MGPCASKPPTQKQFEEHFQRISRITIQWSQDHPEQWSIKPRTCSLRTDKRWLDAGDVLFTIMPYVSNHTTIECGIRDDKFHYTPS